jgi:hypothetical protein
MNESVVSRERTLLRIHTQGSFEETVEGQRVGGGGEFGSRDSILFDLSYDGPVVQPLLDLL